MNEIEVFLDEGSINKEEIDKFERKMGFPFPESYKNLLAKHNALYPKYNNFDFYNSFLSRNESRDVTFLGYGDNVPEYNQIDRNQDQDVYMPTQLVIIGATAEGDYVCLDYRGNPKTENPPIVLMYHDAVDENRKMYVDFVAKDFDTFMDSLYGLDDDDQKIYPTNK